MLRCSILLLFFVLISTVHGKKGSYLSPCRDSENCAEPLVCRAEVDNEDQNDLRCRARIKAGERCRFSRTCVKSHNMCSSLRSEFGMTRVCHKPPVKNETCLQNWHCAGDLVCRAQNDELRCLPRGKVGDICELQMDCEEKLLCRKKFDTDKQYTCQKKAKNGEACFDYTHCEGN